MLSGHRPIPIQETVHNIRGFDLAVCSNYLTEVSLGKALFLRKSSKDRAAMMNDLVGLYRNHPESDEEIISMKGFENTCYTRMTLQGGKSTES